MTQNERISHYEALLDEVIIVSKKLDTALEDFSQLLPKLKELEAYYGSEQWRKDFEDDEKGLLPENLKRGILSEDLPYDALQENRQLLIRMLEIALEYMKA